MQFVQVIMNNITRVLSVNSRVEPLQVFPTSTFCLFEFSTKQIPNKKRESSNLNKYEKIAGHNYM